CSSSTISHSPSTRCSRAKPSRLRHWAHRHGPAFQDHGSSGHLVGLRPICSRRQESSSALLRVQAHAAPCDRPLRQEGSVESAVVSRRSERSRARAV
ncbi:hypothetical protein PMAYCL1PPCAC_07952, partial [Pristionchus mayeri]